MVFIMRLGHLFYDAENIEIRRNMVTTVTVTTLYYCLLTKIVTGISTTITTRT